MKNMSADSETHILIIGAGITGLTLAQALRKRNQENPSLKPITYSIFERDPDPYARGAGWGLTLHWALEQFLDCLPEDAKAQLPGAWVDKDSLESGNLGSFKLFNLQTGENPFFTPASKSPRNRFAREKLREALMHKLDIQWSKNLTTIEHPSENEIVAIFEDGTTAKGNMLIGCDGSRSNVRRILCPNNYQNNVVPNRLTGVSVPYSPEKVARFQALDPYFFQCCDPATNSFMFFGFLKVPGKKEQEAANGTLPVISQVLISWPYRPGFLGHDEPVEVAAEQKDRIKWLKTISKNWVEPFREIAQDIPDDAEAKIVNLEDWPPVKGAWDNAGGKVTLIGDAAHAMTMYRGEAANHGIADVTELLQHLLPENHSNGVPSLKERIDAYESGMIERANPAVLRSRQACMDAHDFSRVGPNSPLVAMRIITETTA
ncbi:hypothetical protein B7463_g8973, partial [Scytalidium lignicola]